VNLVTDSVKMLWDISHIRWLHRNSELYSSEPVQRRRSNREALARPAFDAAKE
jgi:hypothetical protein